MSDKNASKTHPYFPNNKKPSTIEASSENKKIEGHVPSYEYSEKANSRSQGHDTVENAKGEKTVQPYPHPPTQSKYDSQLGFRLTQIPEIQYEQPMQVADSFMHRCQNENDCTNLDGSAVKYPHSGEPCEPEYVHPHPPREWTRRPHLPKPPEMLSSLKQGIRHPCQITYRKKEMEMQMDKLTDEHRAFAFPPDTRAFFDNAYYSLDPALSLVENYDINTRDIEMQQFHECPIRPALLAFNRDKYRLFRKRLPLPEKRILNIPGNRTSNWHNWLMRPLRTTYTESWRRDIKVPNNWFGPTPSNLR